MMTENKQHTAANVIRSAWQAYTERKWRTIMAALDRGSSNLTREVDDDYTEEHRVLRALYHGGELL